MFRSKQALLRRSFARSPTLTSIHQAAEPFKKFIAEVVPSMIESVSFVVPFGTSFVSVIDAPL